MQVVLLLLLLLLLLLRWFIWLVVFCFCAVHSCQCLIVSVVLLFTLQAPNAAIAKKAHSAAAAAVAAIARPHITKLLPVVLRTMGAVATRVATAPKFCVKPLLHCKHPAATRQCAALSAVAAAAS
jgi:hypothetical protein